MAECVMIEAGNLLSQVQFPEDLRKLKSEQLFQFTEELRDYLIEHGSKFGGHFAASLGVVELTTALHYVFDTPHDQLIWDVGHQAYGHKVITGRRDRFFSNRLYKGISGFPKRTESEYDTFGVGHSSTSISAAVGMAVAAKHKGEERNVVAVIGDGALTGGMAFEALNHAGWENANMLVILNDNCMSIDPNVGALKEYLTDITTSRTYNKLRDEVWKLLGKLSKFGPSAQSVASKVEDLFTAQATKPGMLFEALKFRYFGPIDGHDVNHLVRILSDLKKIPGPKILHCVTVKGKGYALAELDQTKWHAPSAPFDRITGMSLVPKITVPQPPKYQDVFGHTMIELAKANDKVMGVTPAMPSGCSLNLMLAEMPDRAFDVGIAEQHAVTFSAGLATQGLRPFCNIYSTFMQRAYDQVIHDVAIQKLPVVLCLDRGGLVGADGATHHGAFDLAYFRCIPNMIVASPMNEQELRNMMYTAQLDSQKLPFSIRYPRGNGVMIEWRTPFEEMEIGKGRLVSAGEEVAVLSIGHHGNLVQQALKELAQDGLRPAHYDMRFVKPIDEALLHEIFSQFDRVITIEDGCIQGGFGSAVLEFMSDHGYQARVKRLGIPDRFIDHGTQEELWDECGYGKNAVVEAVRSMTQVHAHS
jgi:1-deoxy-D-xylulose-5-phosphate synthase